MGHWQTSTEIQTMQGFRITEVNPITHLWKTIFWMYLLILWTADASISTTGSVVYSEKQIVNADTFHEKKPPTVNSSPATVDIVRAPFPEIAVPNVNYQTVFDNQTESFGNGTRLPNISADASRNASGSYIANNTSLLTDAGSVATPEDNDNKPNPMDVTVTDPYQGTGNDSPSFNRNTVSTEATGQDKTAFKYRSTLPFHIIPNNTTRILDFKVTTIDYSSMYPQLTTRDTQTTTEVHRDGSLSVTMSTQQNPNHVEDSSLKISTNYNVVHKQPVKTQSILSVFATTFSTLQKSGITTTRETKPGPNDSRFYLGPNENRENIRQSVRETDNQHATSQTKKPVSKTDMNGGLNESQDTFRVIWNIPSRKCGIRHGILPKLSKYDIIHNKHQHFYGDHVVIFYANHLGFYPRILEDGETVNGGTPLLANLDTHLAKATSDIEKKIPNKDFDGFAVIDWESWRPLFRRNWGIHRLYKNRAIEVIAKRQPTWNYTTVKAYAKKEFDASARRFLETTLSHAKSLRPKAKWGFYLFPECYNYRAGQDYCHRKQMNRNDRLWWMFRASGALYPSIYLTQKMSPKYRAGHIKGILNEAYRIQRTHTDKWNTPVFPYARIRYGDTDFLLSQEDLEGTIGQAATTGAAGIILWERYINTVGKRKCFQLQKYVRTVLGPYLRVVQNFVKSCSNTLCKGRGRCVRKKRYNRSNHIKAKSVSMFLEYKQNYNKAFRCSCQKGWTGARCGKERP